MDKKCTKGVYKRVYKGCQGVCARCVCVCVRCDEV